MASADYSFLDIAVLDEVRTRFAAGDALALLAVDLDEIIWANGPGATFLGFPEIEDAIGAPAGLGRLTRRQIESTHGFPEVGRDKPVAARFGGRLVNLLLSAVVLPDGQKALLLARPAPDAGRRDRADALERAISGFDEAGHFAALLDREGNIATASRAFDDLGISGEALRALVEDVSAASDRLVKRLVSAAPRQLPAGIARLTDDPALHLLIVVDEADIPGAFATTKEDDDGQRPTEEIHDADNDDGHARPVASSAPEGRPHEPRSSEADHSEWYFRTSDGARAKRPAEQSNRMPGDRASAGLPQQKPAQDEPGRFESGAVKFAWRTDARSRFTAISGAFAAAIGEPAADVIGRSFGDVAEEFGLDPSGEIAGLLARRDTWSGRTVHWPVAGTDRKVPVDLAALPAYGRDRTFEGFRGFGIARMRDFVSDPDAIGMTLATPENPPPSDDVAPPPAGDGDDPFQGETPALVGPTDTERGDKVVRLSEHRPPSKESRLSVSEQSAFHEIAERLKRDSSEAGAPAPVVEHAEEISPPAKEDAGEDAATEAADSDAIDAGTGDNAMSPVRDDAERAEETPPAVDAETVPAAGGEGEDDDASGDAPPETRSETPSDPESPQPERDNVAILPSAFSGAAQMRTNVGVDTTILAHLPMPVLVHKGDDLHFANPEFLALTGYESLAALDDAGGLGAIFVDPYDGEETAEPSGRTLTLGTATGEQIPVEAHLQSVPWHGGTALLLALRRATPPTTAPGPPADAPDGAVDALIARADDLEARLFEMRTIIDTATDGVVIIDNDGTIRSISRPAEALFGYENDDATGTPFTALFAIESRRAAQDYIDGLADNGVASVLNDGREVIGRESKGRFIPLFMTIGRLPQESGYCAVVRDITQWKRAEEELTQARTLAERSSSQKTEFLARVSHEIRTPLNAIIGFSELMLDEKFGSIGSDRHRDYLRDINRSGNHVLDLVNDLLDISKIEAGEQEMHYEAISLNETLGETVAMMQPQANRERVIIRSSFVSRLPDVVADLRSVRQIGLNLLSNAIRYTQAGGQVIVSTSYEPSGDVIMRVRDTGLGMSPAEIDQAMKPFKQLNTFKRSRGDGTGLGLPLTRAMVEANRARFTISSTPGEGTLVEITFPSTRVLAD